MAHRAHVMHSDLLRIEKSTLPLELYSHFLKSSVVFEMIFFPPIQTKMMDGCWSQVKKKACREPSCGIGAAFFSIYYFFFKFYCARHVIIKDGCGILDKKYRELLLFHSDWRKIWSDSASDFISIVSNRPNVFSRRCALAGFCYCDIWQQLQVIPYDE